MNKDHAWREPWKLHTPAFAITESLCFVGNRSVSCHLIKTAHGAVLIDTAYAETAYLLTDAIRSLGIAPDEITLILHTHGHVDHCGATRRMRELTGATVAMGEQDIETVGRGTALTCAEYLYGITDFETFAVDRALRHGDTIDAGGTLIHCHHTPGHTAGTITYTFDVLVGGERLTAGLFGGPGLWTMREEHRAAQGYPGNREDFARSLAYLKTLDVDVWLGAHPGQNDTFGKYQRLSAGERPNPFIDPLGWKRFIERIDAEFQKLVLGLG